MTALVLSILVAGFAIAFVNGANDVSKGIATLVGSGVTDLRRATRWGALCTGAGGLAGAAFGGAMLATFGGGLTDASAEPTVAGALATLLAATGWVVIATRRGLPVSTTHAIVGALAGAGVAAHGVGAMDWSAMGGKLVLPLLLSPVASFLVTAGILRARRQSSSGATGLADCLCADVVPVPLAVSASGALFSTARPPARLEFRLARTEDCPTSSGTPLRLTADRLHWLASGSTSFARGLNDGPKMAALMLAALALAGHADANLPVVFAVITLGMVAGSLVGGRRVTRVLAHRVTPMDHREGLVASAATALLVTAGALGGLPMSTTHVASTAIAGVGTLRKGGFLDRATLRSILLAWLVTAPVAALLAAVAVNALSLVLA